MTLDVIEILCELIAIPSVNPMGTPVAGDGFGEGRLTDYLEALLQRLGLSTFRQHVEPGRDNLLARFDGPPGTAPQRVLMLEAHQDTVPVVGMTIAPFEPIVRDGRVYGRGACDVKGGMTAILAAVARLVVERPADRMTIVVACTVNEENGFTGAEALVRGLDTDLAGFLPQRPAACVVAEPTSLNIVVAHRGVVRWRCHTHGRAAHSARPQQGDNAIYKMARVVTALQTYAVDVVPSLAADALCGRPTLSIGTIAGGSSVNTVPDHATIEIDRRTVAGEDPLEAWRHVQQHLAACPEIDFPIEHEAPYLVADALSAERNGPLARGLITAGASGPPIGVPYGTNASSYEAAMPAVVFGPGSIDQAHTADEWIAIDQVTSAAEILYRLARGNLGR